MTAATATAQLSKADFIYLSHHFACSQDLLHKVEPDFLLEVLGLMKSDLVCMPDGAHRLLEGDDTEALCDLILRVYLPHPLSAEQVATQYPHATEVHADEKGLVEQLTYRRDRVPGSVDEFNRYWWAIRLEDLGLPWVFSNSLEFDLIDEIHEAYIQSVYNRTDVHTEFSVCRYTGMIDACVCFELKGATSPAEVRQQYPHGYVPVCGVGACAVPEGKPELEGKAAGLFYRFNVSDYELYLKADAAIMEEIRDGHEFREGGGLDREIQEMKPQYIDPSPQPIADGDDWL